tara:strand:- start:3256 stop:4464 length:1209 start_codon:yes stop_codon:yes gene_type:complete
MHSNQLNLPKNVEFCKICVISNQRPNSTIEFKNKNTNKETIIFDNDSICSACKYNIDQKEKKINWDDREKDFERLLDKFRKNDGSYDVIVPGSGGKDSAYASHLLKYKYGMNPLTVTWAPHEYTDIGWKNFNNWIKIGGFDNILFNPNGRLHRKLTNLAFKNILHPFQPFIIGQRIIGPLMALKYDVKLVMYGENQAEYGNRIEENKNPKMSEDFFSVDDPKNILLAGKKIKEIINDYNFKFEDFAPYIPPSMEDLQSKKVEVHYMGFYKKWDPQECFYYAVENTGFQPNSERTEGSYSKYSSIDDKIDPFHYYTTLIKFGIGRATYDASQEIRNDKITREEGVILVNKYDTEFPSKYFEDFLKYTEMSKDEFWESIDKNRSEHLWEKAQNEWKLKHQVKNI